MAQGTLAQKVIDAHLVSGEKATGSRIELKIDQTLTQDATGTMACLELEAMGVLRVNTELSVSYVDHNMIQNGPENRNDHLYLQSVAAAKGIIFSCPGNGICHQVHLERFGVPGKTLLGADSHTPTNGGIGMIAIGAGGLDVAMAMAGKPFQMAYPYIVGIELTGRLAPWVSAKDNILKVLSAMTTKGNVGKVVEYFGEGVASLSVPQRATITNMGTELGVTTSVFPSDEITHKFLQAQGRGGGYVPLAAEPDAVYDSVIKIDMAELEPLAACPSSPDNIKSVAELAGMPVGQVIIGSCTNSSLRDLSVVALMLKDRKVCDSVTLAIAPGSRQVLEMMARDGTLADLVASGARILETACGPCIGQCQSPSDDTVTLRTFNRNFPGRTGSKNDRAYLVSPETAAASALTGMFTDPRTLDMPCPEFTEPEKFLVNDKMLIIPPKDPTGVEIIRKPTIGSPPTNDPLPENIKGVVIIKVGDKITTDHISPAGIHLKLRSNIPAYSKVAFECFSDPGKPSFAERAAQARDSGVHGIIVAGESYGQGSSREHAAICPMFLGIKAVIAISMERIHSANLVNFGIIPLIFKNKEDYDKLEEASMLEICEIRSQLVPGGTVIATTHTGARLELGHNLSAEDVKVILAGGRLNV